MLRKASVASPSNAFRSTKQSQLQQTRSTTLSSSSTTKRFLSKQPKTWQLAEFEAPSKTGYKDQWYRHRQVIEFDAKNRDDVLLRPLISLDSVFIAPSATIAGNVVIYQQSSIWYNCVLKGDVNAIKIGAYTNIQDGTVIQEALGPLDEDHDGSTIIGHLVTIGHGCVLRACTVEPECIVGMGCVLEEGSYMEKGSILGANSVLPKGARIPAGQVWGGQPAKFIRDVHPVESTKFRPAAINYSRVAQSHNDEFWLPNDNYKVAEQEKLPIGFKDTALSRFFFYQ